MNEPITITAEIPAFLSNDYALRDFMEALQTGTQSKAVDCLTYSYHDMDSGIDHPWTRVGVATVTLVLAMNRDELVAARVASLKGELEQAHAAWLTRQAEIMAQISKLQALEYVPEAV